MEITLAPIPFYWTRESVFQFYENATLWPVDRIVLGENVCSKRRELSTNDWLSLAKTLTSKGKQVSISTLALLEAESELKTLTKICSQTEINVEANDLAAVELLYKYKQTFSAGPYLNIYSPNTLKLLMKDGLQRWTLPVELGRDHLSTMTASISTEAMPIKTEVMAYGYLPLALSARCFTARAIDRPKDQCEKICIEYSSGIPVDSQEQQRLFVINGIQTLSGEILDLRRELSDMQQRGVDSIRISPTQHDMRPIIQSYKDTLNDSSISETPASTAAYCNGYWFHESGFIQQP